MKKSRKRNTNTSAIDVTEMDIAGTAASIIQTESTRALSNAHSAEKLVTSRSAATDSRICYLRKRSTSCVTTSNLTPKSLVRSEMPCIWEMQHNSAPNLSILRQLTTNLPLRSEKEIWSHSQSKIASLRPRIRDSSIKLDAPSASRLRLNLRMRASWISSWTTTSPNVRLN